MALNVQGWDDIRFVINAAGLYQFRTHVAGGGDIEVARYLLSATASRPVTDNVRVGLGFTYEFEDYSFSGLTRCGGQGPWNGINRVGFGGGPTYRLGQAWNLFVSPSVQCSGEEGADFGESLVWGGVLAASCQANPRLRIGLGAGSSPGLCGLRAFRTALKLLQKGDTRWKSDYD